MGGERTRRIAFPSAPPQSLSVVLGSDLDAEHPLHVPHGVQPPQHVEGRRYERVARDGEAQQGAQDREHGDVEQHEDKLLRRALALLQGRACVGGMNEG